MATNDEKHRICVSIEYDRFPSPTKLTRTIGWALSHDGDEQVARDMDAVIAEVFAQYKGQEVTEKVLEGAYTRVLHMYEQGTWPWKERFNARPVVIVWGTSP